MIIFTEEDCDSAIESEKVGVEKLSGLKRWGLCEVGPWVIVEFFPATHAPHCPYMDVMLRESSLVSCRGSTPHSQAVPLIALLL